MYRKFYIDEEIIQAVVAALIELQSLKIERLRQLTPADGGNEIQHVEAGSIQDLLQTIDQFKRAIRNGETEQDENEQLAAIDKFLKTASEEAGYGYGTANRLAELKHYLNSIVDDKHRAYRTFARLADDMRVKLLAVQFLIAGVSHAATHREKNTKLDMLADTIDSLIEGLTQIDKDNPHYYDWHGGNIGSWDYVKALTDLHHRNSAIKRLQEENEELRQRLGEVEGPEEGEE